VWPMRFYDDFPVPEAGWVSTLGPFNEHLARDFGSSLAGLGVIAVLAGLSNSRAAVRGVMTGFVLFGVPHLVYHLTTFDEFSVASALTQLAALGHQNHPRTRESRAPGDRCRPKSRRP